MDVNADRISKELSNRSRKTRGGINVARDLSRRLSLTREKRAIAVPGSPDEHLDHLRSRIADRKRTRS